MLSNTNFDKSKLLELLRVHHPNPSFWHGQLRVAASRMIREYGYQWAISCKGETVEETNQLITLSRSMRHTVFEATEGWHSNKSVVWRRFKDYTKKVGIRLEAKKLIDKVRAESKLKIIN